MEGLNGIAPYIGIVLIFVATFIFTKILDMWINLQSRWETELKSRFLDWRKERKKKAILKRLGVNKFKLERLSDVESEPTPEMIALVDKMSKDMRIIESYKEPELSDLEMAEAITEADITLSTLIFNKIDEMILVETQNILVPLASTGRNIDVRNYGDHVKNVAEAVQKGLNIGVYKSTTMFTPEYINTYIVKKSSIVVLTTMTEMNRHLPPPE